MTHCVSRIFILIFIISNYAAFPTNVFGQTKVSTSSGVGPLNKIPTHAVKLKNLKTKATNYSPNKNSFQNSSVQATHLKIDQDFGSFKNWKVFWNKRRNGCFAELQQENGTFIFFGLVDQSKHFVVGFRNVVVANLPYKEIFQLNLLFDRGKALTENGFRISGTYKENFFVKTFLSRASKEIRQRIAASNKLTVKLKSKNVAALSLNGSAGALNALESCRKEIDSTDNRHKVVTINYKKVEDAKSTHGGNHILVAQAQIELVHSYVSIRYCVGAADELANSLKVFEAQLGPRHKKTIDAYVLAAEYYYICQDVKELHRLSKKLLGNGRVRGERFLEWLYDVKKASQGTNYFEGLILTEIQKLAGSKLSYAIDDMYYRKLGLDGIIDRLKGIKKTIEILGDNIFEIVSLPKHKQDVQELAKLYAKRKDLTEGVEMAIGLVRDIAGELAEGTIEDNFEIRPILNSTEIKRLLTANEKVIVYNLDYGPNRDNYVTVIDGTGSDFFRLSAPKGKIKNLVKRIRQGLDPASSKSTKFDPTLAHELYQIILHPIEEHINKAEHLIFVLDGALTSLPPQILIKTPPGDKALRELDWLVRDHAITIMPSVASIKLLRTSASSELLPSKTPKTKPLKTLRAYADPIFDLTLEGQTKQFASRKFDSFYNGKNTDLSALREGLPRLPATSREVLAVAKAFGVPESEIRLREAATETAVKTENLDQYDIIYFATHALVAGEVKAYAKSGAEPALVLTLPSKATEFDDGLLTSTEITALTLNANWVVLSACNTAAGGEPGADALSGLATAFFYAGARSLLVSHWVVDDIATSELMTRVFKFVATSKNAKKHRDRRPAEALRNAMLSMLDDPDHEEWADPSFWAPFVLVGEPEHVGPVGLERRIYLTPHISGIKDAKRPPGVGSTGGLF